MNGSGFGFLRQLGQVNCRKKNGGAQHAAPLHLTASPRGPGYRFDIAGTTRIRPNISATRSAAIPRTQPIARAITIRTPPLMATARAPMAVAAPASAPVVYDSSGMRAWNTMPKTAAPRSRASRRSFRPSAVDTAAYSRAHTTPDAEPSTDFCSPITPPPAPTKHARPTMTGQSCNGSLPKCEMTAHRAATIARLNALVVEALIGWASSKKEECGANIMNGPCCVQRLRG